MKTILVVDDFASVCLYHTSFLTQKGYQCIAAHDGAEALVKLAQHPVDLVLLDMIMPNMNGCEFVRQVRAQPAHAKLPIVVITSEAKPEQSITDADTHRIGFLLKPVLPDALLRKVQALLP